jgi:hypothetical protein
MISLMIIDLLRPALGGFVDGSADAHIGGAAAEVARHRVVDVGIGRLAVLAEQRDGAHDLAGLAVAALHDVELAPGFLHHLADAIGIDASMVVILRPTTADTGVVQARTGVPSTCTVQAPHSAWPQPYLVPVMCRVSRSAQSSGRAPPRCACTGASRRCTSLT